MRLADIAAAEGLSIGTIAKLVRQHRINKPFKPPPPPGAYSFGLETAAKASVIIEMRRQRKTLEEIGRHFGISRERVRQILVATGNRELSRPEHSDHALTHPGERETRRCLSCGAPFMVRAAATRRFCNIKCAGASRRTFANRVPELLARRRTGETWTSIAADCGYTGAPQSAAGSIINHIRKTLRAAGHTEAEIDELMSVGRFRTGPRRRAVAPSTLVTITPTEP